jgi:phosphate transport system protein
MRETFHGELAELIHRVVEFARLIETALESAGTAMLQADPAAAERVLSYAEPCDRLHAELDERAIDLIARQQPVATDLRTIVAVLRMNADLERMGALTRHIAELAKARHPAPVVTDGPRAITENLAAATYRLVGRAIAIIAADDTESALLLEAEDDQIDRLQNELYRELIERTPAIDTARVLDVALIGRYYERIADHAVSLGRCVAYRAGKVALD